MSDPGEIYDAEQYSLLSRHLDAAARDCDHLVVVRGADGSGKTTLLNRYVTSLGEDTFFATVDQSCENETSFYCTFLQQLGFDGISGKPAELRHITNEFLIHRARANDTVLLIIDNVHHVRPSVLEQLRNIAATRFEAHRVISTVITGNSHVRRIMDSPAMDGLKFREYVDFHIRAYSESETGAYIRHRLRLAGDAADAIFEPDSYAMIHRYSGGIPGQINKFGSALLVEAVERKVRSINAELVRSLAESRQLPPHLIPVQGKGRRKSDRAAGQTHVPGQEGVAITARSANTTSSANTSTLPPRRENLRVDTADLLARLARVSEQIERLNSDKQKARQDITERDRTIAGLTEQLGSQSTRTRALAETVRENARELDRLRSSLATNGQELNKSAELVRKLTADLKSESSTARSARKVFERAEQRISKLEGLQSELHETVAALRKELEVSNEKAARAVVLQRELEIATEKMGRIESLQSELAAAREECSRLQSVAVAKVELEASLAERDSEIEKLRAELAGQDLDSTSSQPVLAGRPESPEEPDSKAEPEAWPENAITRFDVMREGKLLRTISRDEISTRCMIGRGEDCELRLTSKGVSRHHALLICTRSSVSIKDLNSVNGTHVNFERTTARDLNPDDVILIGDFQIRARHS